MLISTPLMAAEPESKWLIGELFPSGKLYLEKLDATEGGGKVVYPSSVYYVALRATDGSVHKASKDGQIDNAYVPAIEGQDHRYDSKCKVKDASAQQNSDFFGSDAPECYLKSTARYRAPEQPKAPRTVIAFDSTLQPEKPDSSHAGKPRPLSEAEKRRVADQKKAAELLKGCTTTPAFLDSAVQLLSVSIKGSGTVLRWSSFLTPGCAGHLALHYVVDVLEKGVVTKTFEFSRYRGGI